ncbi:MAG: translation initiation factor IF-2 [Deltaproteobacteria bacterium]|jgi:translation initiation factor IF-2|nr:translation initiation factor IF-2 [Deltaproteobacteria bacterium]
MGKKRIHELAKELSLSNAELIQRIKDMNIMGSAKITSSHSLEESQAEQVRRYVKGGVSPGSRVVVRRRKKQPGPEAPPQEASAPAESPADPAPAPAAAEPGISEPAPASAEAPAQEDQIQSKPVKIRQKVFDRATIVGTSPGKAPLKTAKAEGRERGARQTKKEPPAPDFLKLKPRTESELERLEEERLEDSEERLTGARRRAAEKEEEAPLAAAPEAAEEAALETELPEEREESPEIKTVKTNILKNGTPAKIVGSISPRTPPPGFPPLGADGGPSFAPSPSRTGRERPGVDPATGQALPDGAARARRGKTTREFAEGEVNRGFGSTQLQSDGYFRQGAGKPRALPGRKPDEPGASRAPGRDQKEAPSFGRDGRKKDRRKKTTPGTFDGGDDAARAFKRRNVVEQSELYADGVWEKSRQRKSKSQKKVLAKTEITRPKQIKRRIKVDEAITVAELAHRLSLKAGDIIKKLMGMGVMAGVNQSLDFDTASLVANEFDYEVEKSAFDEGDFIPVEDQSGRYELFPRPPVVTIMGHVDHGKTSLLDYIRESKVQEGEAGGITQHIGAYHVKVGDRFITFLDTPGHEAFTSMRSRGAQVTDIVILIVAADDGVMPQTREAADHAKAAKVPIIVAVNKIDKPGADPEKVRRQMMELGLTQEAWGGDTVFCDISAKSGQGVSELLEMILLQADLLNLKSRREGPAKGRVIEARLDKGRGAVATVLVEEGTLRQGDNYVCGIYFGKLRALLDDQGRRTDQALPATPVEIQGISGVPLAGDEFVVLRDEKQARQVSQHRQAKLRESVLVKTTRLTLENLFDHIKEGSVKGLNLVIKCDVQGSLEAILDAVMRLDNPEIKISVLHSGTGAVTENDVMLASASSALIICFGLKTAAGRVQDVAEQEQVQIRYYDVIYKLIDDLKEAMAGLLDPVKSEKVLGFAEVRVVFNITKVGPVAGSAVTEGRVLRGALARLHRGKQIVYTGKISTLKREKNDVREVLEGYECGIGLENFGAIEVGDRVECYQVEETAATVDLINQAVERASEKAKEESAKEEA